MTSPTRTAPSRTRWAAIGAAVAVSLGAGGIGISQATSDGGDGPVSAFFPIEPCRILDTRPNPNTVGSRTTPLGPDETYTIGGWGANGNCELPTGITGLAVNVTAVDATQQTNLRLFPKGDIRPTSANLNPAPDQPPTPNAANVALNTTDGEFSIYNRAGEVTVIIDVMGYYDDHTHDDRYSPRLFATITNAGEIQGGSSGLLDAERTGLGSYVLTFDQPVATCAAATADLEFIATRDVSADPGFGGSNKVTVVVTDENSDPVDTAFNIIVVC
jgi:hypothetical protein